MLTMHPTLLIGPSDWQSDVMPRQEFDRRIEALWRHDLQAERAIVYGNSAHHAELAYFTNLVPKLEAAVAILSRTGAHRLLLGGGVNMLAAARPLTFIENLAPLKDIGDVLHADRSKRTLVVGTGYMPNGLRRAVTEAVGNTSQDATAQAWSQMRVKSAYELRAIDAALKTSGPARKAMGEALILGAGVTEVVAAGEQAAYAAGAQDVRSLFSLDGGRTLRPFSGPVEAQVDPLILYFAVRRFNHWAEVFPQFTQQSEMRRSTKKPGRCCSPRQMRSGPVPPCARWVA